MLGILLPSPESAVTLGMSPSQVSTRDQNSGSQSDCAVGGLGGGGDGSAFKNLNSQAQFQKAASETLSKLETESLYPETEKQLP